MESNQYATELAIYLLVLVVYFYELIIYMLLERNAFDSIAFFSQCKKSISCVEIALSFLISSWVLVGPRLEFPHLEKTGRGPVSTRLVFLD